MCKLQGLEKIPEINKRRAFKRPQGLEKNAKSITVGPRSIPDSRVWGLYSKDSRYLHGFEMGPKNFEICGFLLILPKFSRYTDFAQI